MENEHDEEKIVNESKEEEILLPEESEPEFEEVEWIDDGITAEAEGKPKKRHRWVIILICAIAAAFLIGYLVVGHYFSGHYLPGTVVNGIDCSYMTVDELGDAIQDGVSVYRLEINERDGITETLYGSSFDLHAVYGDALEEFLDSQEPYKWPAAYFGDSGAVLDAGDAVAWDEEKFAGAIEGLECMDAAKMTDPRDAEIVYSEPEGVYYVEPAVYGTHIRTEVFEELLTDAVSSLAESVDLEEAGCYLQPEVTEESPEITSACDELNLMISADITYDMADIGSIHIPEETIRSWVILGEDLSVSIDEEAVSEYVAGFAENYNTADKDHTLVTTWGPTVTITDGSYGWRLDREGEAAELIADIEAGETVEREPVWSKKAASHGANDYGGTYVEVNLTAQYLYFYKEGELIIETPFVSGKMTEDRMTHEGIYSVFYMQSPAVLKGDDYETPVTFWMPFNGGEGLHDATWRSSFGGDIYINNGSHGCINLPYSAAETIYENMTIGTCVIVYWLDGTSGSAENGIDTGEAGEQTIDYLEEDENDNQYEDLNLQQFVNEG